MEPMQAAKAPLPEAEAPPAASNQGNLFIYSLLIKSIYFILSQKADSAPSVDVGCLRNKPPPRESTDSRRWRRRANAVLSSKIIILIRATNFKTSAPAAAADDDDEEEDADRAMMDTENELAAQCK